MGQSSEPWKERGLDEIQQSQASGHLVQIGQWVQTVQLFTDETNKGNLERVSPALPQVNKRAIPESDMGEVWFFALSPFLEHKECGVSYSSKECGI